MKKMETERWDLVVIHSQSLTRGPVPNTKVEATDEDTRSQILVLKHMCTHVHAHVHTRAHTPTYTHVHMHMKSGFNTAGLWLWPHPYKSKK